MNDYTTHGNVIDNCPNCNEDSLELIQEHELIICFKCKWIIDAKAWTMAWSYMKP